MALTMIAARWILFAVTLMQASPPFAAPTVRLADTICVGTVAGQPVVVLAQHTARQSTYDWGLFYYRKHAKVLELNPTGDRPGVWLECAPEEPHCESPSGVWALSFAAGEVRGVWRRTVDASESKPIRLVPRKTDQRDTEQAFGSMRDDDEARALKRAARDRVAWRTVRLSATGTRRIAWREILRLTPDEEGHLDLTRRDVLSAQVLRAAQDGSWCFAEAIEAYGCTGGSCANPPAAKSIGWFLWPTREGLAVAPNVHSETTRGCRGEHLVVPWPAVRETLRTPTRLP